MRQVTVKICVLYYFSFAKLGGGMLSAFFFDSSSVTTALGFLRYGRKKHGKARKWQYPVLMLKSFLKNICTEYISHD